MSSMMCMICLSSLDGGSELISTLENSHGIASTQCGHILHIHCLLRWWDTAIDHSYVNATLNHHVSAEGVHFVTGNPVKFTCPVCGTSLGKTALFFQLFLSFAGSESDSGTQKVEEPTKKVDDREAKSPELSPGPSTSADK